jgi:hypothetical protein
MQTTAFSVLRGRSEVREYKPAPADTATLPSRAQIPLERVAHHDFTARISPTCCPLAAPVPDRASAVRVLAQWLQWALLILVVN